eukprot:8855150-Prorocentrum_lima.AAC.1
MVRGLPEGYTRQQGAQLLLSLKLAREELNIKNWFGALMQGDFFHQSNPSIQHLVSIYQQRYPRWQDTQGREPWENFLRDLHDLLSAPTTVDMYSAFNWVKTYKVETQNYVAEIKKWELAVKAHPE